MYAILIFLAAHHFLSLFSQTFFLHRYAAHQVFTMSKFWEKVFFVCNWLFQGSSYLSPATYGKMHRLHHAYADTEKDVHSPKHDKTIWNMMVKTKDNYTGIHEGEIILEDKFLGNLPEWGWFDKFAHKWPSRLGWGILYTAFYVRFVPEGQYWLYLLLPLHTIMGPLHGIIINWFAHKVGYRNHKLYDTSTNMFPIDILMLGEGLHNNHHAQGQNPNFAQKWFEFDPSYAVIKIFSILGIVKLKK